MPELPEVETMAKDLRDRVLDLSIVAFRSDTASLFDPFTIPRMRAELVGSRIADISRRGKVVIFSLLRAGRAPGFLGVHPRMTGHFLYGKWVRRGGSWRPETDSPDQLRDGVNRAIRCVMSLSNGMHLAFADTRKFGRFFFDAGGHSAPAFISHLGPEPFDASGDYLSVRLSRISRPIKQALLDQTIIAGIGNIYADEILWQSRLHPLTPAHVISIELARDILASSKLVLRDAITARGSSMRDYRDIAGLEGGYRPLRRVYQRTGEPCYRCRSPIERAVIGGRSAHFCPRCQKIVQ